MTAVAHAAESPKPAAATTRSPRGERFLFYSHDALGLGHLRRNLSIARAVAEVAPQASILLATSAEEAQRFALPRNVDILRLPGLRKVGNGDYAPRRLNVTRREMRRMRESLLLAAVDSFRPSLLLVDKHPLGLEGELEPALSELRAAGGKAVLGLRDVLDDPAAVRSELGEHSLFDRIVDYFDRVLVYGQPDILDARRVYGFPAEVAAITRFCGYVVSPANPGRSTHVRPVPNGDRPHVLASAGGGQDGFALLSAFVEAAAPQSWDAALVSGPHCNARTARMLDLSASRAGVTFRDFVPELSSEFGALDALVCMGGYNTLAEALASGVSTVCVPRAEPRREQLIRARAFARRGLLTLVEPSELDPDVLRAKIEDALARDSSSGSGRTRPRRDLDLGGARRAAEELLELIR